MSLTEKERDALPASDFAVPGKRVLPIHDQKHVAMAWSQVGRTKGLSDTERAEARKHILERAHKFGMDTSDWDTIKAMRLEAMAILVPEVEDHPNRMPFSGVLTKLDEPSNFAPHGSRGKRIMMTSQAAKNALDSLAMMGVDVTAEFDGHDARRKIGVITAATIEGSDLRIEGIIYAADFPEEAAFIKANKDSLGFSFEAQHNHVESLDGDPLVITACVFTGAAILLKDKAAFTTTSLAAAAAGEIEMTKEELQAIIDAAVKPLTDKIATIEAGQADLGKKIEAGKELHSRVAPHADKLRAAADGMCAAGIGTHVTQGHVAVLRRMADSMEAEAMNGIVPHVFRDHDYYPGVSAAADPKVEKVEAGADVKALKDEVANLKTQLTDAIEAAKAHTDEPVRKTVSPQIATLLARAGADSGVKTGERVPLSTFEKLLAGKSIGERIRMKTEASRAGLLDETA
jgi:hypothetical protein